MAQYAPLTQSAMAPKSMLALSFASRRNTSPGPPSPTFTDATNVSAMHFGAAGPSKIITRTNLKSSVQAYEDLLNTCGNYRAALLTMSKATATFADAMGRCSSLKGPSYETGTRLQAASGVHHLMGNLWHVLADSLDKGFEKPLRQHLENYKTVVNERSQTYERALRERSQIIRDTETRNMNRKERNLQTFREALAVLQRQVDELDELKLSHYQEIIEHEEEVWDVVQSKICLVVRSTMDVFDRFASKASDPVIEPMLQSVPDPFDSYGPPQSEDQIFSILGPLSISMTPNPESSSTSPRATPERDIMDSFQSSSLANNNKVASWLPGTNGAIPVSESPEWATVSSPTTATPPRSPSPPRSRSPPSRKVSPPNASSRRHSFPQLSGSVKKAETKLRSVLAIIEEDKMGGLHRNHHSTSQPALPSLLATSTASPDPNPPLEWNVVHHISQNDVGGDETPRNSISFPSCPPPLDADMSLPDFAVYGQHVHTKGNFDDPIPQQT